MHYFLGIILIVCLILSFKKFWDLRIPKISIKIYECEVLGASLVEVVYMAGSIYGYVILYYNIINK